VVDQWMVERASLERAVVDSHHPGPPFRGTVAPAAGSR
jgi:hypothetical protein